MSKFGPLATRSGGRALQPDSASIFYESWTATGTSADGSRTLFGKYSILRPTNGKAFFYFLLDASASTSERCSTGERKCVYEYLLEHFAKLILNNPDVVHPHDEIVVWVFNNRVQHLCTVQQKDFHTMIDSIRKKYCSELVVNSCTRLYDAVGVAMDHIQETWKTNTKADFFLVPFTDGKDNNSSLSLEMMWRKITNLNARLHTFFLTANLPTDCELYRLLSNQSEMTLISLENTEPREICRGFTVLRDLIKAILVVETQDRSGESGQKIRIANYASTKEEMGKRMVKSLANYTPFLEGFSTLRFSR